MSKSGAASSFQQCQRTDKERRPESAQDPLNRANAEKDRRPAAAEEQALSEDRLS